MKRCAATSLISNDADDVEIAEAIDEDLRNAIGPALGAALDEISPASPNALFAEVTAIVGLIGQDWRPDARDEYIGLVVRELADLPGSMVLDALARARRRVTAGRLLISWICDDVEPRAAHLKAEVENLTRLANLARHA